jgi:two-component system, chemotaxis family, protein-glutamate methylesterase/glutaminase
MSRRIRVLIVDDSALVRQLLTEILGSDAEIDVVGAASDAHRAREMIKALNPDVLTLDVEMPKMDGITFLRNLMRLRPTPVVMVSTLTERGADITLEALGLGAVDFVSKPKIDIAATLGDYSHELVTKVKLAAQARVRAWTPAQAPPADLTKVVKGGSQLGSKLRTTDRLIAIGASTGGVEAIKDVLTRMPADAPAILITQHIPKAFSAPFARRMNDCCQMTVCEAADGQQILRGHVYIAPGDRHLTVVRDGARYVCRLDDGTPVSHHKPSVDVLFRSVAHNVGADAIGVLLTGMGKDGAHGLKEMLEAGSSTLIQDEATSVVWGMPGAAFAIGAAQIAVPLTEVHQHLISWANAALADPRSTKARA